MEGIIRTIAMETAQIAPHIMGTDMDVGTMDTGICTDAPAVVMAELPDDAIETDYYGWLNNKW